jgi:hypothetical protein
MFLSMSLILAASGSIRFGRIEPRATGRPGYHPSVLLKLYIYGYLNRVQSSRRLEREAGRNVEVMWLTGRLVPDHKTIADFRKDNGRAIRKVCVQFVGLCRRLDLLTEASVAIDGRRWGAWRRSPVPKYAGIRSSRATNLNIRPGRLHRRFKLPKPGNPSRHAPQTHDRRQAFELLTAPDETIFVGCDLVPLPLPLSNQSSAGSDATPGRGWSRDTLMIESSG